MNKIDDARDRALELVEDGYVDPMNMLTMCLKYMSTDDVAEMLDMNELSDRFIEEDDEEESEDDDDYDDGQPSWSQEWEDFGECYE